MTNLMLLSNEWYLATALYDAIDDGNLREVIILVQEKYANPNIIIPDYGITPFHLAVGHQNDLFAKAVTKFLLKNGGNPNIVGTEGITPLHVAVAWNRSVIVRILLSYGADPFIIDDTEKNAFHYAYDEHAWETLKILEIHSRTQRIKFDENEEKNYNIQLDKVIIHANDVQAEYRAFTNSNKITLPSKKSVSTQTSLPFSRLMARNEENKLIENEENENVDMDRYSFNTCYDWCEKVNSVLITDDCKRKIISHRAKSNVYEYSPGMEKSASYNTIKFTTDTKKKFFPIPCCFEQNDNKTDDSELKNDSFNTVREIKIREKGCDKNQKNYRKALQTPSNNLVLQYEKTVCYPSELFSEESLISEDQDSDCRMLKGNSLFNDAKDIPFIDESLSGSSLYIDHTSQKSEKYNNTNEPKCQDDEKINDKKTSSIMVVPKEDMKHISWSGFLSNCTCVSTNISNSLSMENTSADLKTESKNETNIISGVQDLPDTTSVDKSNSPKSENVDNDRKFYRSKNNDPMSANMSIELKYTDDEDGIEFIEARLPFSSSSKQTDVQKLKSANQEQRVDNVEESEVSEPNSYDTDYIRKELKKLGIVSGPIAGTSTKKLYLRKLKRMKKTIISPITHLMRPSFSSELEQVLHHEENWIETLSKWSKLETEIREHFSDNSFSSTWRAGSAKTSFTYLLLDPYTSNNLPARCNEMDLIEVWRTFVHAIFYIGKGTRARPYEHLHEAFLIWRETKTYSKRHYSLKVKQILDIWKSGLGVVCVQAFHNLIPAEAYTREAAMIDAIGMAKLKNEKCGMYYGVAASWNSKLKRRLGVFLLYRAMRIFIAENEIQLKPTDVR